MRSRSRLGDDTTVVTSAEDALHPELERFGLLLKEAREAKIDDFDILLEMAGFAATYAQMLNPGNDPLEVALLIAAHVMAEEPVDCPVTGAEHDWGNRPRRPQRLHRVRVRRVPGERTATRGRNRCRRRCVLHRVRLQVRVEAVKPIDTRSVR